jgi:hypothetical protein
MTTTLDIASGAPAAPALRAQMDQGAFAAAVFVLVLFAEPVFAYLTKIEAPDTAIRLIWLPVYAVIAPFLIGRGPQVLAAACRTPLLLALGALAVLSVAGSLDPGILATRCGAYHHHGLCLVAGRHLQLGASD